MTVSGVIMFVQSSMDARGAFVGGGAGQSPGFDCFFRQSRPM
jgi:hypothetical protein